MLSWMAEFSLLWLSNIPLCECTHTHIHTRLTLKQHGFNCTSPLTCRFFSISTWSTTWSKVGWTWEVFSSVTQSCPTLWDRMNCSMPGLPFHHQLLEFTQTHVHWVGNAIQPSHPLSSPSPPALNFSQHQGLFKWVSSLHQVAKVLQFQFQLQHQLFQWIFRTGFLLGLTSLIFQSKGLSRVFSNTTVQKHQFFGAQLSL